LVSGLKVEPVKLLIYAAVIAVVAIVLVPFFAAHSTRPVGPEGLAGQPAPVFALSDDRGAAVSLAQERGKIVVMNLWASWCPPCRAEMPDLQRLANAYAARGVVVIGVNEGESPERARAFARSLGIAFPVWIDDQTRYGRAYAALGMPTTIVLDRDGIVTRGFDGALSYDQMRDAIAGLVR
jgi:thiol-disulfide isomerase/thioredoxin